VRAASLPLLPLARLCSGAIQKQIGVLMINGFPIQLAGQNQSLFLVDLETKSMKQWNPTQDDLFAEDWVITALAEVPVPTFHTEDPDHG